MSEPRAWNRREFTVAPNGYFNVLKPTGWFAAFRLPDGFRYRGGKKAEKQPRPADKLAADPSAELVLPDLDARRYDLRFVLRTLGLILAAIAATFGGLLWIMHP